MPLAMILLAAATPIQLPPAPARATLRTSIAVDCAQSGCDGPRRSRYRLDPQQISDDDGKAAALAETGHPCETAARVCTKRPRTVFTAALDN